MKKIICSIIMLTIALCIIEAALGEDKYGTWMEASEALYAFLKDDAYSIKYEEERIEDGCVYSMGCVCLTSIEAYGYNGDDITVCSWFENEYCGEIAKRFALQVTSTCRKVGTKNGIDIYVVSIRSNENMCNYDDFAPSLERMVHCDSEPIYSCEILFSCYR